MASYKEGVTVLGYTMCCVCEFDELRDLWILVTLYQFTSRFRVQFELPRLQEIGGYQPCAACACFKGQTCPQ
jgi:hypothetical protein